MIPKSNLCISRRYNIISINFHFTRHTENFYVSITKKKRKEKKPTRDLFANKKVSFIFVNKKNSEKVGEKK